MTEAFDRAVLERLPLAEGDSPVVEPGLLTTGTSTICSSVCVGDRPHTRASDIAPCRPTDPRAPSFNTMAVDDKPSTADKNTASLRGTIQAVYGKLASVTPAAAEASFPVRKAPSRLRRSCPRLRTRMPPSPVACASSRIYLVDGKVVERVSRLLKPLARDRKAVCWRA